MSSPKAISLHIDNIELLRTVFQNLDAGVIACDENRKLISASPEARANIWGLIRAYRADYLDGSLWLSLTRSGHTISTRPIPPQSGIARKEVRDELIFVRNQRQPSGTWIRANGRPIKDSAGAFRGAVMVFRDVLNPKTCCVRTRTASPGRWSAGAGGRIISFLRQCHGTFRTIPRPLQPAKQRCRTNCRQRNHNQQEGSYRICQSSL